MMSVVNQHIAFADSKGWLPYYQEAATFYNIPIEILLAKDSRESWLGSFPGLIQNGWYGSDRISKGISQINVRDHKFARETDPNEIRAYVAYGAQVLKAELIRYNGNLAAALAAYNTGPENVDAALEKGLPVDIYTTENNYSSDVLARAKEIRSVLNNGSLPVSASTASLGNNNYWLALLMLGSGAYYLWRKQNDA